MIIELERDVMTDLSTMGILKVLDPKRLCMFTLEDKTRTKKVYGKTCIPPGKYQIIKHFSPRFNNWYPMLTNVPGFDGILIHAGNKPEDTDGCILVGRRRSKDYIYESRNALAELRELIFATLAFDNVWIDIKISENLLDFRSSTE